MANRSADNLKNRAGANGVNTQNVKARANAGTAGNAGGLNRSWKNSPNRGTNTTAPRAAAAPRANNAAAGGGPWGTTPRSSGGGFRSSNAAAPARQQGGAGDGLKAKTGQGGFQRPAPSGDGGGGMKARGSAPKAGGGGGFKRKG
jgi:hypothetical protein